MALVNPVILCGGSGTRLWPLSRKDYPKQFITFSIDGYSETLFQQAIVRLNAISDGNIELGRTLIVTNADYRYLILDQLCELKGVRATLLLEPSGRNTAPALTLAALQVRSGDDPILVVAPADQIVKNLKVFTEALQNCIAVVDADQSNQTIVILGVTPTSAETGYGYIHRDDFVGIHNEYEVKKFVEKPDVKTAQAYLDSANYLWNSGIFVLRASTWIAALKDFRPDIFEATEASWQAKLTDQADSTVFVRPDTALFNAIPSDSIDYAVIEKCPGSHYSVKMVELDAGWNDLGGWDAVWQVSKHDDQGNVTSGDTIVIDSKNSLVQANSRLVSIVGVENLIIVEMADAVLVADRGKSQGVKYIVNQLELQKSEVKNFHRKVVRPWGWYDNIDQGESFKVKRIQVKPGASLSLQIHHYRAEHWVVVAGVAEIINGDQVILLTENQSTYIPIGKIHRLTNPGKTPLEIIEVQTGSYLGEDDIVRLGDIYGRS